NPVLSFGTNTFTAAPTVGSAFRIDSPVYSFAQFATPNSPAPGEVDEAGAAHNSFVGGPVGTSAVTVFSFLMRAIAATPAGEPLVISGDPADLGSHPVALAPNDPNVDP